MRHRRSGPVDVTIVVFALLACGGIDVDAQDPSELAGSCAASGGERALCTAAAASSRALAGQLGLLAGSGSAVPGTASNLGTRVGGGPRLSFFGRASGLSIGLSDASDASGVGESSSFVPAIHVGAAAGLFDGFRIFPTVGGFLSTDLFVHAAFLFPSTSDGYDGGVRSVTGGVRLGLLREGFTVPGLSVSVARRLSGSVVYGDVMAADAMAVQVDPSVTSLRATIGKDLFAVELLAGIGWDDVSGDATLTVSDGVGGFAATSGSVDGDRRLYFASAARTFSLVLSLSVEAGWAEGFSAIADHTGEFDPTAGSVFGGLSARLVF